MLLALPRNWTFVPRREHEDSRVPELGEMKEAVAECPTF
jgi:hypothetical protein